MFTVCLGVLGGYVRLWLVVGGWCDFGCFGGFGYLWWVWVSYWRFVFGCRLVISVGFGFGFGALLSLASLCTLLVLRFACGVFWWDWRAIAF